jgi:hypothetical protein
VPDSAVPIAALEAMLTDLPGFHGIKKAVVGPERNFGLVDLHHALQRLAVGINLELDCRHTIRVRRHEMRGPEPHR